MNSDENSVSQESQAHSKTPEPSELGTKGWFRQSLNPFRIATLRGLGVILPPLLTIIFFFWAWNTIERAVLRPVEATARYLIVWSIDDIQDDKDVEKLIRENPQRLTEDDDGDPVFVNEDGEAYRQVGQQWIPLEIHSFVVGSNIDKLPQTAKEFYHRYVQLRYLKRHLVIPAFLAAFIAFLYLTGKLLAAGVGRILWRSVENLIHRVPIIRNVYSSVKQVTDFAFNENEIQFNRVVALEYPRKGIWSVGFVTGESLLDIRNASGEPMLSVLMPTSPMPATGFTISIPKSETIDLDLTIDQAIQFCVSCGVVIPEHQQSRSTVEGEVRRRFKHQIEQASGQSTQPGSIDDDEE